MAIHRDLSKLANGRDPWRVRTNGQKRTAAQHENDMVFISERYLRGYTQQQITDELNAARVGLYELSVKMIAADITMLHQRWLRSYLVNFDEAKAKELAHIDALEAEYWEAWRRSQKKIDETESEMIDDTQSSKNVTNPHYSRKRVKKIEKNRDGDPKFLAGVERCIERRCRIMGLDQTIQNINVNWRKQAEQAGVDPDGVVDDLVKQFIEAASVDGTGGGGSLGEGAKDTEG